LIFYNSLPESVSAWANSYWKKQDYMKGHTYRTPRPPYGPPLPKTHTSGHKHLHNF
jgi:hypothetical protein